MSGRTISLRHRSTSSVSLPFAVMAGLHPKRHRNRTALLALLAIISLSGFIFCTTRYPLSLAPAYLARQAESPPPAHQMRSTPKQELAAVSSFLASLPQNVIPPSVDPSRPIDPELVLDFDTRSPRAPEEIARVVDDVWARNPVLLYGKLYSPATRELKSVLSKMNLRPPPFVMDVDTRDDVEVLAPLLARLTGQSDLPVLLVGGRPVGSVARIREMVANGELERLVKASGAVVGGGKRRKHA
ncbi:hypothetical protein B0H14DRAFT_3082883 [Mycena olivaceomarginata]|nr:hypothetical protein B0H14DRAFT_3082883 [Mycena olivaceomarginata]